jgi:hypothetical protein
MLDPISAVTPRAVLRTAAHLPYVMPFMFGAAIGLNACTAQSGVEQSGRSGNNPDVVSVSYTPDSDGYTPDLDATARERTAGVDRYLEEVRPFVRERVTSVFPTSDEHLAELLRYGSNGP